jgi:hypothetical protein
MSRSADVFVECDTCGGTSPEAASTIRLARAIARRHGWVTTGDTDTCFNCRPGQKKQIAVIFWRDAVVQLLRRGMHLTYEQIGEITGLTRQRIHQICQHKPTNQINAWIHESKERFNAEITVSCLAEPEEATDGDHHG